MGIYSEDININGITYSSEDDLNNQMANKIYQFLLNTGDFSTDVEISSGYPYDRLQHLIKIADNIIYIDKVRLDITVSSGTLYIKHISNVNLTTSTTTFKLTTFLRNLTIANGEVSCDDDFTLIYRGYKARSFFINVSTNVNNGMNLRFFEFIVFCKISEGDSNCYGGTRNITVTANTYNPVITTAINAISVIYLITFYESATLTIPNMDTYSTTPNTVFDNNQYTRGRVVKQDIIINDNYTYHFTSLLVGNTNYYSQFEYCYIHESISFKIDEGVYYCFSDGCLLQVDGAKTPVSSS